MNRGYADLPVFNLAPRDAFDWQAALYGPKGSPIRGGLLDPRLLWAKGRPALSIDEAQRQLAFSLSQAANRANAQAHNVNFVPGLPQAARAADEQYKQEVMNQQSTAEWAAAQAQHERERRLMNPSLNTAYLQEQQNAYNQQSLDAYAAAKAAEEQRQALAARLAYKYGLGG